MDNEGVYIDMIGRRFGRDGVIMYLTDKYDGTNQLGRNRKERLRFGGWIQEEIGRRGYSQRMDA